MTVSVCITHEGSSATFSQTMFENQVSYVLENFQVDKIYIICEDEECPMLANNIFNKIPYQIISAYSSITETITYITPPTARNVVGDINLKTYNHPADNVCYVIGPNDGDMVSDIVGDKVFIETSSNLQMYNWVALAITLYDRDCKRGNS